MSTKRAPPRFVPTLTEVVQAPAGAPAPVPAVAATSEEQLVQRVLKRVDLTLDRKLREAIASAVLEHTRSLGPALRERLEIVVRQAVAEALAEEAKPRQRGQP
jgi:hypothetical protein